MLLPSRSRAAGMGAQSWMTDRPHVLPGSCLDPARRCSLGCRMKTGLLIKALGIPKTNSAHRFQGKGQLKIYSKQKEDTFLE